MRCWGGRRRRRGLMRMGVREVRTFLQVVIVKDCVSVDK